MNFRTMKTKTILILCLTFVLCSPSAFSQANAGEDKTICGQNGVVIGGGTENPDWCYYWSPHTGLDNPNILHPTANPATTTTYTLTVVGPDFSFQDSDQMTVFVENVSVALTVENNINECMEGRQITFTAEVSASFPVSSSEPIKFTFHFEDANGNAWTHVEWSIDRVEYYTAVADDVPAGDADHKFTTPIFVEAENDECVAVSPTLNIDVYELWIDYVRYNAAKPWKAVVGENIEYQAIASSDCHNWDWDMEDGWPDAWNPTGGDQKTGNMVIPYSDLARASNSWFGEAYGTVNVFCEDGEGNNHRIYSTELNPSKKVAVFFDPDKNVDGGAATTAKPPCWFVFWKDGVVVQGMGSCGYDQTLDFGAWSSAGGLELGPLAPTSNSGPENLVNMVGVPFVMTGTGKHLNCVAETMVHELYHKYVYETWNGQPDTDGDELPNAEEPAPHRAYFQISDPNDHNTFNYALYATSGYADQEVRCRIEEIGPNVNATYPNKDWSKDAENPKW